GYLPEAVINFLAMVGWNPGTEQEIFSMAELIKIFDIKKVQKKGGIFNIEKLDWLNKEYIKKLPEEEKISNFKNQISKTRWGSHEKIKDQIFMEKFMKLILEKIHRWSEVSEILEANEYDYLFEKPTLDKEKIAWKTQTKEKAKESLEKVLAIFESETTNHELSVKELAEKEGKGEVLWPLRYALSGREKSPDPFSLIGILSREECSKRISGAISLLSL
ncbi:MAG: glutamate--tRNA ligase family protein, partial [Candidatus Paceibacterota bacterium]